MKKWILIDLFQIHLGVETKAKDLSLTVRETLFGLSETGDGLALTSLLFGAGPLVRNVQRGRVVVTIGFDQSQTFTASFPEEVQAGIDGYSRDPGRKGRSPVECIEAGIGLDRSSG